MRRTTHVNECKTVVSTCFSEVPPGLVFTFDSLCITLRNVVVNLIVLLDAHLMMGCLLFGAHILMDHNA